MFYNVSNWLIVLCHIKIDNLLFQLSGVSPSGEAPVIRPLAIV